MLKPKENFLVSKSKKIISSHRSKIHTTVTPITLCREYFILLNSAQDFFKLKSNKEVLALARRTHRMRIAEQTKIPQNQILLRWMWPKISLSVSWMTTNSTNLPQLYMVLVCHGQLPRLHYIRQLRLAYNVRHTLVTILIIKMEVNKLSLFKTGALLDLNLIGDSRIYYIINVFSIFSIFWGPWIWNRWIRWGAG